MHRSITLDYIIELVEADENIGICVACGEVYDGLLEPDACKVECPSCGKLSCYGVEEVMLYIIHKD